MGVGCALEVLVCERVSIGLVVGQDTKIVVCAHAHLCLIDVLQLPDINTIYDLQEGMFCCRWLVHCGKFESVVPCGWVERPLPR